MVQNGDQDVEIGVKRGLSLILLLTACKQHVRALKGTFGKMRAVVYRIKYVLSYLTMTSYSQCYWKPFSDMVKIKMYCGIYLQLIHSVIPGKYLEYYSQGYMYLGYILNQKNVPELTL